MRMEGHLAQCTMIPKGISFPQSPRDFRLCSYCGRIFLAGCIDEHRRSCRQVYYCCGNCKTSRIPAAGRKGHLLNCPRKKRSWCNVILLRVDMDVHRNTCSFMACSRCRKKKMTMAEFTAHQKICMPLIRCTQCSETNPSSMEDHLETCNYRRCTLCGKWKISLEQLYSHQLACIKLRRCKGCNQSVKVADYFTHVDSCEPYYCKQCGKQHSVLVDNLRPEGPQTRRCTQCKTYFSEEESLLQQTQMWQCKLFFPKDYLNEHQ